MPEPVRILFVGEMFSSHAQAWVDLLLPYADCFSVRGVSLVAMPRGAGFPVTSGGPHGASLLAKIIRRSLRARYKSWADPIRQIYSYGHPEVEFPGLVRAIRSFDPHIVHTFGFTPSALIYGSLPASLRTGRRWVLQTRGGSDVAFAFSDPLWASMFAGLLPLADIVLCDNLENYRLFAEAGISARSVPSLPFVPGAGGLRLADFEPLAPFESRERLLVWGKAYESPWSKALPVLEGLRLAWDAISPVRCVFTAADREVCNHIRLLPENMRSCITVHERIPRSEMLQLVSSARVFLAPSLVDGIPNSLYEAMAAGVLPIVSPLPTITPHFTEGENVFYARNLYPEEIANALVRAFNSSDPERMILANRNKVAVMADRVSIAKKVAALYADLAQSRQQ